MTMIRTRVSVTHTRKRHVCTTHASSAQQNDVSKKCTRRRSPRRTCDLHGYWPCSLRATGASAASKKERCSSRSRGEGSTASDGADKSMFLRANRQQSDHVSGLPRHAKKQGRVLDLTLCGEETRRGQVMRLDGWRPGFCVL